jgi:metal-responsive CopG/Arc/MetJ family transcriptional regulator
MTKTAIWLPTKALDALKAIQEGEAGRSVSLSIRRAVKMYLESIQGDNEKAVRVAIDVYLKEEREKEKDKK